MKRRICWAVGLLLTVGALFGAALAAGDEAEDRGPDPLQAKVIAFYQALVQEAPPGADVERAIFRKDSGLRAYLEGQPNAKKSDAPVLTFFREHRSEFLPANFNDPLKAVHISTPFAMKWNALGEAKEAPAQYVMVFFAKDAKARPGKVRTLIFGFNSEGKISDDEIYFDGFEGRLTMQVLAGQP